MSDLESENKQYLIRVMQEFVKTYGELMVLEAVTTACPDWEAVRMAEESRVEEGEDE